MESQLFDIFIAMKAIQFENEEMKKSNKRNQRG